MQELKGLLTDLNDSMINGSRRGFHSSRRGTAKSTSGGGGQGSGTSSDPQEENNPSASYAIERDLLLSWEFVVYWLVGSAPLYRVNEIAI